MLEEENLDMPMPPHIMIGELMIGQLKCQFTSAPRSQRSRARSSRRLSEEELVPCLRLACIVCQMIGAFLFTERGAMNKYSFPKIGYKFGKITISFGYRH